jgi:hypothetical protein
MTCSDSHELLQQRLDGDPIADRGELDRHLADCPACRDLYASAQRLQECLQSLTSPIPPTDLSQRILVRWLEEHRVRARRRRRLLTGMAIAAALFVAVFLGYSRWRHPAELKTDRSDTTVRDHVTPRFADSAIPRVETEPSLNRRMEEAGSALIALMNRTADETVGQGKVLLPAEVPTPLFELANPQAMAPIPLEPPVESLREAQHNVALGLEPVTNSARRAVNLFLREMPQ